MLTCNLLAFGVLLTFTCNLDLLDTGPRRLLRFGPMVLDFAPHTRQNLRQILSLLFKALCLFGAQIVGHH